MVSNGFTDQHQPIGAGTITIDMGAANQPVRPNPSRNSTAERCPAGQFRITDASGKTEVIDTTSDITVDDVLKQINTSLDVSVNASVQGNQIVLTDTSGGTGTMTFTTWPAARRQRLGIAGPATAGILTGHRHQLHQQQTQLNQLNDGRGIQLGTGGNDLTVTLADGTAVRRQPRHRHNHRRCHHRHQHRRRRQNSPPASPARQTASP